MDITEWILNNLDVFSIIFAILGIAIFVAPLMCWFHCADINKKMDKLIKLLKSVNDNTTLSLINSDDELKEKLIEEMNEE